MIHQAAERDNDPAKGEEDPAYEGQIRKVVPPAAKEISPCGRGQVMEYEEEPDSVKERQPEKGEMGRVKNSGLEIG